MLLAGRNRASSLTPVESMSAGTLSQVLKIQDIIPRRMNTYSIVEASLKTRGLSPFRMNSYRKSPPNHLYNEHLQKNLGGWGLALSPPVAAKECTGQRPQDRLLPSAFRLPPSLLGVTQPLRVHRRRISMARWPEHLDNQGRRPNVFR